MIIIGGKPYRTLADHIYANGKRVQKVFVNGKQAYPEKSGAGQYSKGSKGQMLKVRGFYKMQVLLNDDCELNEYIYRPSYVDSLTYMRETINSKIVPFNMTVSFAASFVSATNEKFTYSGDTVTDSYLSYQGYNIEYDRGTLLQGHNGAFGIGLDNERISISTFAKDAFQNRNPIPKDGHGMVITRSDYMYGLYKLLFKINIDPIVLSPTRVETYYYKYLEDDHFWNVGSGKVQLNDNIISFERLNNKIFVYGNQIEQGHYNPMNGEYETEISYPLYGIDELEVEHPEFKELFYIGFRFAGKKGVQWLEIVPFSVSIKNGGTIKGSGTRTKESNVVLYFPKFRCPVTEIMYLGPYIDSYTNTPIDFVKPSDLFNYNGTESIEYVKPSVTELESYDLTTIDDSKFEYSSEQKKYAVYANFPNAIYVGNRAFTGTRLLSANFPKATYVGSNAFADCYMLTYNFDSLTEAGDYAFANTFITQCNFPKLKSIGERTFGNCAQLSIANFPVLENIGDAALSHCENLSIINASFIKDIPNDAFNYCLSLTEANFPYANAIGTRAFLDCHVLKNVNIPLARAIGNTAFRRCSLLSFIDIPKCVYIRSNAFYQCVTLESIYLTGSTVCSLESTNAFYDTPLSESSYIGHFGSIYVPGSLVSAYQKARNWSAYKSRITAI